MSRLFVGPVCTLLFVVIFAGCSSCKGAPAEDKTSQSKAPSKRLIMLGFDGVDPDWVDRFVREGKLPNIEKLIAQHDGAGYRRLRSTNPPQSPVAWTTFATGLPPGDHGIFDFIGRKLNPGGGPPVLPKVATTSFEPQKVGPPVAKNLRHGEPFWQTLANRGIPVLALNVPYSFPPDPMKEGRMLSGLGTPDIRGTNSTFTYAGTDISPADAQDPPGGGVLIPLRKNNGVAKFELEGPRMAGEGAKRMSLPVELHQSGERVVWVAGETKVPLELGEFSDWVELDFQHEGQTVRGIARVVLLRASPRLGVFITPVSFHPRAAYSPISYPNAFAAHLADALGRLYKTVGWDHDTSALNAEVLSEELFLRDMEAVERDRRAMLMHAFDKSEHGGNGPWRFLAWVSTSTDRVAHMFYRLIDPQHPRYDPDLAEQYADAIEREYLRMDETIGKVVGKLRPTDTLLVLSDHGFHNFRRGLHVNQWLREQGLLTLKGGAEASERDFLLDVDWSKTQAYALGTGQIYVNLEGREPQGIVDEDRAKEVLEHIRNELPKAEDPQNPGVKPVRKVYLGSEVFEGQQQRHAPDAQIAFEENYRTSWETILGGVPAGLFVDNTRKWSGDHAASDVEDTEGVLMSTRRLQDEVAIVDMAPTAMRFFDEKVPARYIGEPVFRKMP